MADDAAEEPVQEPTLDKKEANTDPEEKEQPQKEEQPRPPVKLAPIENAPGNAVVPADAAKASATDEQPTGVDSSSQLLSDAQDKKKEKKPKKPKKPKPPPRVRGDDEFTDDLCFCHNDPEVCFMACCCPCFLYANILKRAGIRDPVFSSAQTSWCLSLFLVGLLYSVHSFAELVHEGVFHVLTEKKTVEIQPDEVRLYSSFTEQSQFRETSPLIPLMTGMQLLDFLVWFAIALLLLNLRTQFKRKYGLNSQRKECNGICCNDCCVTFFCGCCSLAQIQRHLDKAQNKPAGSWGSCLETAKSCCGRHCVEAEDMV